MSRQDTFNSVIDKLRAMDTQTQMRLYFVLESRRKRLFELQHFGWDTEPRLYRALKDIAGINPNGLLPKSLAGYYSIEMGASINITELVSLVRDLKVINII